MKRPTLRFTVYCWLALLALHGTAPALAQARPQASAYNSVDLQGEAQREVANDTLHAVMYAELNDADPAKLADALNRAAAAALAVAKEYPQVRVRSGSSRTYPVYDESRRLVRWRGRTDLRMESKDFPAASALIGRLQSSLQLDDFGFSVSPEARRAAVDSIIEEAIKAFRARADIVRSALGGRSYRIRRLAINSGDGAPRPLMAYAVSARAGSVTPPPLEGGVSQISLSVSGTIEVE